MSFDFKHPELHLAHADARTVAALVSAAADLTLVVGGDDVIRDLSHNLDPNSGAGIPAWRGLPIDEVVRSSSRPTLKKAFKLARSGQRGERFDVSHLLQDGRDLPVQYSALGIGTDGSIMLLGRDLRLVSELQSRLMANRHSLEQNARTRKQAEAHYRLLFETAADAVVIVDASSGKVREANPCAAVLLGVGPAGASGRKFTALFDRSRQAEVQALLSGVLASGKTTQLHLDGDKPLALSGELFRAGDLKLIMVRLASRNPDADESTSGKGIEALVRSASEAVVLTDLDGKVLWANESCLVLADKPLAAHALGMRWDDFFHWSILDQDRLLQNVRKHGRMPAFSGTIKGANGQLTEVELSAVAMAGESPGYGFVMRAQSPDSPRGGAGNSELARAAESLVEMVGSVPMKDLVRDTTDVIERMCIEAALKLTGDNRASAARVLGLSRQALYLKMNRFGIADG